MSFQFIHTGDAPEAIGPYSQAVRSDSLVFLSGQIGLNPKTGEMVSEDFTAQVEQTMENLLAVLHAAGCQASHVLSVDVYLTDMAQFPLFNEIYGKYFSRHKPARAVVEVSRLPKGAQVEIKCVARHQG